MAITWVSHANHMLSLTTELYINRPRQWSGVTGILPSIVSRHYVKDQAAVRLVDMMDVYVL